MVFAIRSIGRLPRFQRQYLDCPLVIRISFRQRPMRPHKEDVRTFVHLCVASVVLLTLIVDYRKKHGCRTRQGVNDISLCLALGWATTAQ